MRTSPSTVHNLVTITTTGVTPTEAGSPGRTLILEFINHDSDVHDIRADPHPAHSDCLELNVGPIMPGERRLLPSIASGFRCGYHDDTRLGESRFQGLVSTQ